MIKMNYTKTSPVFQRLLKIFPKDNDFVFAYGSGAFQQTGQSDIQQNMLDLIFVVKDPVQWHKENLKQNKSHYSFLRYTRPALLGKVQDAGAGIYFNTLVPWEKRLIKYGVMSRHKCIADLLDWETLYISGRLHKPVLWLHNAKNHDLETAYNTNLQSAVHTALLLLPERFTEVELYSSIAGLSYSGDFRMMIGEDKNKVQNIVNPNVHHFRSLYEEILNNMQHVQWEKSTGLFEQDNSPSCCYHHLSLVPKSLQFFVWKHRNKDGRHRDLEESLLSVSHDFECSYIVANGVSQIVRHSSITQSLKGIFTAGIYKSFKYSAKKLKKMVKSMTRR